MPWLACALYCPKQLPRMLSRASSVTSRRATTAISCTGYCCCRYSSSCPPAAARVKSRCCCPNFGCWRWPPRAGKGRGSSCWSRRSGMQLRSALAKRCARAHAFFPQACRPLIALHAVCLRFGGCLAVIVQTGVSDHATTAGMPTAQLLHTCLSSVSTTTLVSAAMSFARSFFSADIKTVLNVVAVVDCPCNSQHY